MRKVDGALLRVARWPVDPDSEARGRVGGRLHVDGGGRGGAAGGEEQEQKQEEEGQGEEWGARPRCTRSLHHSMHAVGCVFPRNFAGVVASACGCSPRVVCVVCARRVRALCCIITRVYP